MRQRRMPQRRDTRPVVTIVGFMLGASLMWAIWTAGYPPVALVNDIRESLAPHTLVTTRSGITVLLLMVMWICAGVLMLTGTYQVLVIALRTIRRAVAKAVESRQRTALSAILTFTAGVITVAKSDANALVAQTESSFDGQSASATAPDQRRTLPSISDESRSLLPALASGGLAVALTSRIQKERERLLRDAPIGARLKAPDSAAIAHGIAMFESAKRARGVLPPDAHLQQAPPTDSATSHGVPLVVPMGVADSRLVSLQLNPGDTISVDAEREEARAVLRHIINTLASAPWLAEPIVIVYGFDSRDVMVAGSVRIANTLKEVIGMARDALDAGERTVAVVTAAHNTELAALANQGAIVFSTLVHAGSKVARVTRHSESWRISTTDECFRPYGVRLTEADDIRATIQQMTVLETDQTYDFVIGQPWQALIRVLGPVEVLSRTGGEIEFRKSKATELLCWLAFHRERATVAAARTALWEIDVRDATFHNVLSEVRRGLSTKGIDGGVGRINKQRLFIDDAIITDGDLLQMTLRDIDRLPREAALSRLAEVLHLVRALPFCAADYAWADAEGITSTLVWLTTRAIERTTELAESLGDEAAVVLASTTGLRMSPGDDTFVMRTSSTKTGMVSV